MKVPANVHDELLHDTLTLEIEADEDDQVYYVWSEEYREVLPTRSPRLERAIEAWFDDWNDWISHEAVQSKSSR